MQWPENVGRFLCVPVKLIHAVGIKEAAIVSQLVFWGGKQVNIGNWISKTREELRDGTGLPFRTLDRCTESLIRRKLIETNYDRRNARLAYRINWTVLNPIVKADSPSDLPKWQMVKQLPKRQVLSQRFAKMANGQAVAKMASGSCQNGNSVYIDKKKKRKRDRALTRSSLTQDSPELPLNGVNGDSHSRKKFVPPTLKDFVTYAVSKQISAEDSKLLFEQWEAGEWHDGLDHPIKQWKQKLLAFRNNGYLPSEKRERNGNHTNNKTREEEENEARRQNERL